MAELAALSADSAVDPIRGGRLSLAGLRRGRYFLRLRRDGATVALAARPRERFGNIWLYSAAAALAAAAAIPLSQELWRSTAAATFQLVRLILLPILPGLTADPATQVLGTQRFAVEILDFCSGLEGMSLILVFTIAWLWYFRKEYRFPRALLLIPLGVTLMFALNAVRIARAGAHRQCRLPRGRRIRIPFAGGLDRVQRRCRRNRILDAAQPLAESKRRTASKAINPTIRRPSS